jgi:hypothetical protein
MSPGLQSPWWQGLFKIQSASPNFSQAPQWRGGCSATDHAWRISRWKKWNTLWTLSLWNKTCVFPGRVEFLGLLLLWNEGKNKTPRQDRAKLLRVTDGDAGAPGAPWPLENIFTGLHLFSSPLDYCLLAALDSCSQQKYLRRRNKFSQDQQKVRSFGAAALWPAVPTAQGWVSK